ncbi:hypothetical protein Tco_1432986, partial [Tanacetum coccineum]
MQVTSGESKSNVEKKNMKKLSSAKETVAYYELGIDTHEPFLKVIDDLGNLLLKVVVVNNNTTKKNNNLDESTKVDRWYQLLKSAIGTVVLPVDLTDRWYQSTKVDR